ncbi:MAG: cyclic lactone autoinducer peptide [Syntrophomonadaceae bacterium]|nr:cyclic lactone autoinducer peptide [Syntrophomonadaceae bacterium]
MFHQLKTFMSTSLAVFFAFIAVNNFQVCCPLFFYQPELPEKK